MNSNYKHSFSSFGKYDICDVCAAKRYKYFEGDYDGFEFLYERNGIHYPYQMNCINIEVENLKTID